jgi:glutaminyl-peptide cyclotransferase
VGHWLNLKHTFEGYSNARPTGGCDPPGDDIADTPAEAKAHHTCDDPARDSCPTDLGVDPMNNFMTYAPDRCVREFTPLQRVRMRTAWNTFRAPGAVPPEPAATRESAAATAVTKTGGTFKVVAELYHDPKVRTEGLEHFMCFSHGPGMTYTALESHGEYGKSSLRKINLMTGEVMQQHDLADKYYGRGLTYIPNQNSTKTGRLVQLTWREKTGLLYDAFSLKSLGSFQFATSTKQGWGVAYRGSRRTLLVTDGSALLHTWNADTLKEILPRRKIYTQQAGTTKPLTKVHELEWDKHSDTLLGIVYGRGTIVRIDPNTGLVKNMYDVSALYPNRDPSAGPLTGIALTGLPGQIMVTGKNWPKIYRIRLID